MGQFYCRQCAAHLGFQGMNIPANLTATTYQNEKFMKHNYPTANYVINSKFDDPYSYPAFAASASAGGFIERDSQNRINWVWNAGKRVGATTNSHSSTIPDSAVKFVHPNNPNKVHGFSTGLPTTIMCSSCGCVIK